MNKKNIGDYFNEVLNEAKMNEDRIIHPTGLTVDSYDGRLKINGENNQMVMNDWAMGQFASKLGIPARYYRMIPPELQAKNANYFLKRLSEDRNWMLRTKHADYGSGLIRGVLTEKYSPFDNHEIMDVVSNLMEKLNRDYEVQMWHHDDGSMHLRVTLDELTTSVGKTLDGKDDIHKVGFHLSNSEVGKSMVRIQPMIYRQVCTNGLMMWEKDGNGLEQRHVGLRSNEIYNRVAEAMVNSVKAGHEMVDRLIKAKEIKVENPFDMIDKIAKDKKYTQKFTETVKTEFKKESQKSLFYVAQAFTAASRSLHADERVDIEKDAAKLLMTAIA